MFRKLYYKLSKRIEKLRDMRYKIIKFILVALYFLMTREFSLVLKKEHTKRINIKTYNTNFIIRNDDAAKGELFAASFRDEYPCKWIFSFSDDIGHPYLN